MLQGYEHWQKTDFGDKTPDFIRDQIIDKCASRQLRTKLLAQKDLTLTKCLDIAAAKEASEKQSSDFTEDVKGFVAGAPGDSSYNPSRNYGRNTGNRGKSGPAKQKQL
jgi:hypothetical protein